MVSSVSKIFICCTKNKYYHYLVKFSEEMLTFNKSNTYFQHFSLTLSTQNNLTLHSAQKIVYLRRTTQIANQLLKNSVKPHLKWRLGKHQEVSAYQLYVSVYAVLCYTVAKHGLKLPFNDARKRDLKCSNIRTKE